jgi:Na+/H+-dicarboxylate symporter/ABC-type amino acid transport substrate-binding protein
MTEASDDKTASSPQEGTVSKQRGKSRKTGLWITIGLLAGVLCGVLFGEYCGPLAVIGEIYVGLLQMTVLPFLAISLVSRVGRLDLSTAGRLGRCSILVMLGFWLLAIVLVVLVSFLLPPIDGASFYSPAENAADSGWQATLLKFVPVNVFHSLSEEYVPAVVVFCLFFGGGLMMVPGKDRLLDMLDVCLDSIGRVNRLLVAAAPVGLFALTADAAGRMRIEELSRLQAYLIMLALASALAVLGIFPALVSSFTHIRFRDFLRAAYAPLLTAVATGKLFVVLPQITEECEKLLKQREQADSHADDSVARVLVPLAYPFPHVGKILALAFLPFAAWYVGQALTPGETATMAATGAVSSFASPLVTVPYLLDQYHLPQDLIALFILPGFITTRLGDVVGVVHLMALCVIVAQALKGELRIRWARVITCSAAILICLAACVAASRWYLAHTVPGSDVADRLLDLQLSELHDDSTVFRHGDPPPERRSAAESAVERFDDDGLLRVGYRPDLMPYVFFNRKGDLVGLDVALMHRLAKRLNVRLEFVPYSQGTIVDQLEAGEIDVAIGGLMILPERLRLVSFSEPYQSATMAIVVRDHRRHEVKTWSEADAVAGLRLGAIHQDVVAAARARLPHIDLVELDSPEPYFAGSRQDLDGLILAAQQATAWDIIYPAHAVVIPEPRIQRPIAFAMRRNDVSWGRLIDQWLEFERSDGAIERLNTFWVEGGGAQVKTPRWCLLRDVLHWIP